MEAAIKYTARNLDAYVGDVVIVADGEFSVSPWGYKMPVSASRFGLDGVPNGAYTITGKNPDSQEDGGGSSIHPVSYSGLKEHHEIPHSAATDKALKLVAKGMSQVQAARACGLAVSTVWRAVKRANETKDTERVEYKLNDSGMGGVFCPATFSLSYESPTAMFTYTPANKVFK